MTLTVTLILPDHTAEKLEELREHYLVPVDMLCQRFLVDRVDEAHCLVIQDAKIKARQVAGGSE